MKFRTFVPLLALGSWALAACQSDTFISVTIKNDTDKIVHQVQVDYPAGPPSNGTQSFGVDHLLPNEQYRYKFKATGDGLLKLHFTDAKGQLREEPGPPVHAGDSGLVKVSIAPTGLDEWTAQLKPKS